MKTRHALGGLVSFFLLAASTRPAAADTLISGTISTSTTWTLAGSPYVLTGNVFVEGSPMPVLTIQPGVVVKFNSAAQLVFNYNAAGALQAVGTSGQPILFTANGSTTPGFWLGLYFGQVAGGLTASHVSYATVEYGGMTQYSRGGIHVWNSSPAIDHVTLRNNLVAGLSVDGGSVGVTASTLTGNTGAGMTVTALAGNPSISGSTISSNSGLGLDVTGKLTITSSTITGNGGYAISVAGNGSVLGLTGLTVSGNGPGKDMIERRAGTISASQTWLATTLSYVVTGNLFVEGSPMPVLTIQPGVVVKFNSAAQLVFNYNAAGALQAVGTSGQPILFTANGSTTPGFWLGLYFGQVAGGLTASHVSYATVEYGGMTQYSRGGIHVWNSSPAIDHVTLRNNLVAGLSVDGGSVGVTASTLTGNTGAGMTVTALAGNPSISGSTISSNSGLGLDVTGKLTITSSTITGNGGYAISVAGNGSVLGLMGLTVSGNGPGKDMIERRAGTISASQTWLATTLSYVVTGNLFVEGSPMPVLTIQPGVVVKFNSAAQLVFNYNAAGALQAVGTSGQPILFTANGSTTPGFWLGLYFGQVAGGLTASHVSYATVEYGGMTQYSRGGIHVWNSSPAIDHVTLRNNLVAGLSVDGGSVGVTASTLTGNTGAGMTVTALAGNPSISGSTISSNSGLGLDVTGKLTITSSTITGNGGYAISVAGNGSVLGLMGLTVSGNGPGKDMIERRAGTISASQTWLATTLSYVVTGNLFVEGSPMPVLTIQPGVVVKFNSAAQLVFNYNAAGALQAVGTSGQPILFTANGSTTPGFWLGLYFGQVAGGLTASHVSYATVEYGGMTQYSRGGIHVWNSSPAIDHVTLRNNLVAGLSVDGGLLTVSNSTFAGNPAGLTKTAAPGSVTARFNFWNAASGPSGAGSGTGQSVAAGVKFEPWLIGAPSQPQFFNAFTQKNRTFNPAITINTTLTLGAVLTGSWTVKFLNSGGTPVRTFTGSGITGTVVWDGKNDSGVAQPDGVYSYQLLDTSSGGSVATVAQGGSVLDRTKQLAVSNLVVDQAYFSPNGDGIQDVATVTGTNNFDDTAFTVNVKTSGGVVVRTSSAGSGLNLSFPWDGKNGSGVVQADGVYTLEVVATNGSASATSSIATTLDDTPPTVSVSAPTDGQVLSNVYTNGVTDVAVTGTATDPNFKNWASDYGAGGAPSSFTAIGSGMTAIANGGLGTWPTLPLANGLYTVRLQAWDKAGNRAVAVSKPTVGNFKFAQDTNQLNNGTSGVVNYTSTIPFILTETIVLKNEAGQIVRTLINGAPRRNPGTAVDPWNGQSDSAALVPAGAYFASATVIAGSYTYTWDQTNQFINDGYQYGVNPSTNYDFFNNRPMTLSYNFSRPGRVSIGFSPSNSDPHTGCPPPEFCLLLNQYEESGPHTVVWSGTDSSGRFLPGMRHMSAWSLRSGFPKNTVVVFGTRPTISNVTATPAVYGPSVGSQTLAFDLTTFQNQAVTVTVSFVNQESVSPLRTVSLTGQTPGHKTVIWDGRADNGMWVAPGFYTLIVTATDASGNRATGQTLTTVLY